MYVLPITIMDEMNEFVKWCLFALKNHIKTAYVEVSKHTVTEGLFVLDIPDVKRMIFKGEIDENDRRVLLFELKDGEQYVARVDLKNVMDAVGKAHNYQVKTFAIEIPDLSY